MRSPCVPRPGRSTAARHLSGTVRPVVCPEDPQRLGAPTVVGDVFAPVELLAAETRLELSALLAVPGRLPAILPADIAALPLPPDPPTRRAVLAAIESGLSTDSFTALAGRRLDAVVPALSRPAADALIDSLPRPVLARLPDRMTGAALAELTIGEIAGWPGFGRRRVAALVVAAVAAGLEAGAAADTAAAATAAAAVDDLVTVLDHDGEVGGDLRRYLTDLAASAPPDVQAAAARLLHLPSATDRRLALLDELLAAAGDHRDRAVFEHGVLPLGPPATRLDLAAALGIGGERIRQLQQRAGERIDAAVAGAPAALTELAALVGEGLGAAAPRAAVAEILAELDLPPLPDPRSRLVVHMAGRYRPVTGHPGWIALDPPELITETNRMLHEDGGVRLAEQVTKELYAFGLPFEHVDAWLARQPVVVRDGLLIVTTGTPGDVAERLLHASGTPLTIDDLTAELPGDWWDRVEGLWSARDRRFTVTDDDELALAEWDADPTPAAAPGPAPRCATLTIAVDRDVLGGAGAPIPPAVARAAGLQRGSRRTFTTRFGPVPLTFDGEMPTRGSVRPVALATGARVGDELVITLYPDRHGADVSLVPSVRPAAADV